MNDGEPTSQERLMPSIAVVIGQNCPDGRHLRRALMSVRQQTMDSWAMVVVAVGEAPGVPMVRAMTARDPRVFLLEVPAGTPVPAALNLALERIDAPYLAVLDQHDFLEPDALRAALRAAQAQPDADLLYTDYELVNEDDVATGVFNKPDWSPERLLGNDYVSHLAVLRTEAIRRVGGYRSPLAGAHEHDLVLRLSEANASVVHVARRLYNRRMGCVGVHVPGTVADLRRLAIQEQLDRIGDNGVVRPIHETGYFTVARRPRAGSSASIIIPTRGGRWEPTGRPMQRADSTAPPVMAVTAVASIVAHKYATEYEIVVVHDRDADSSYLDQLKAVAGSRVKVIEVAGPFNFSRKINEGVEASSGEVIVLLNDDIEVISEDWLDQLVAIAQLEDVGAVGAKLLYEDGTIQHSGLYYRGGMIGHYASGDADGTGAFGDTVVNREVVGVTAACLAQRRSVWDRLGGMDESLPVNFNDVDFGFRVRARGFRIIQANSVVLHHYESKTRETGARNWEVRRVLNRLGGELALDDPFTRFSGPFPGESDSRSAREWVRVTREVLATEGFNSVVRKAGRRIAGRRTTSPGRAET